MFFLVLKARRVMDLAQWYDACLARVRETLGLIPSTNNNSSSNNNNNNKELKVFKLQLEEQQESPLSLFT